jgi:ferredoxin-thioredoxin reductase catalytic subunit
MIEINEDQIKKIYEKFNREAESTGYHLNPDEQFTKELLKSLLINQKRYGYQSCPCRLASGKKQEDLDIICPCDYRDLDLDEYGFCYCALYVTQESIDERKQPNSIPERRPKKEERKVIKQKKPNTISDGLSKPIWRCKVCGYLCAREKPPAICPICKAEQERFEKFISKK